MRRRRTLRVVTVAVGFGVAGLGAAAFALPASAVAATPAAADPFAACERLYATAPADREAGSCFYQTALAQGLWKPAAQRLRHHLAGDRENPWLHYYLANSLWATRAPEVLTHYRRAAELLSAAGDSAAAATTWLNVASFLRLTDRHDEAAQALEQALAAARDHGDPMQVAQIEIEQARQLLQAGQDFARAYWQLRGIEEVAFPDGPYALRRDCLIALGMVTYNLGRWDEVRSYRRRNLEVARQAGDRYAAVAALYGLASVDLADPVTAGQREGHVEQLEEVLQEARAAGHRMVEAQALRDLGRLVAGDDGRRYLEDCITLTRELGQDVQLSACLRGLAVVVADDDPEQAEALLDEALSRAITAGDPWPMVYGWVERLAVRWKTRPRQEALADSLRALDVIEALRRLQGSETGRLGVGKVWSEAYYWLSGRLLGSQPTREELEVAFHLAERARGRSLLEDLASPVEAVKADAATPHDASAAGEYRGVVSAIVDTHRRLLDPATGDDARRRLVDRLDELEAREAALREATTGGAGTPDFVTLPEVEAALVEDEALLAYQLSPWQDPYGEFGGGSWLLVATRGGSRVYPIPDRAELEPGVDLFLGLLQRRDGSEPQAAAALGGRLLGDALADLPAAVDSLVLVPDGVLHQLPFAALRRAAGEPPLAERYRVTSVPSASLWLGWRQRPRPAGRHPALILADPLPAGGEDDAAGARQRASPLRTWELGSGWRPGALPEARREGRRIARLLGDGSRLLTGADASELRLKSELGRYTALHFATHALVDGERPARSGVLLAPGGEGEDGLLQAREIAALDLDDRLVVLSACRGASGAVLEGEGVMSLARAFFQAGARAVVAAPWPLRDDEARRLTEALYRRLAAGDALAAALAGAQRELAAEGLPAAAWAGLQLHGDGTWVPFPQPASPGWPPWVGVLAVLVAVAVAVAVTAWWRRRRRPSNPAPSAA